MAERDVWILGASMTKFGRYPDKDLIDRGGGARRPRRRRRHDGRHGRHGRRQPHGGRQRRRAAHPEAGRPERRPRLQRRQRGATGATAIRCVYMAIKSGEADTGIAVGLEKMGKAGLLGSARSDKNVYEPSGRYGSVMSVEGRVGTTLMPGVFAQAGMEYASEHDGVGFEQFAKVAEKNHAHSTLNPRAVPEAVLARRGHGRRDDGVPEHAADVLPDRRRERGAGAGLGGEAASSPTTSASGR